MSSCHVTCAWVQALEPERLGSNPRPMTLGRLPNLCASVFSSVKWNGRFCLYRLLEELNKLMFVKLLGC